jgi:chaperonin GroES
MRTLTKPTESILQIQPLADRVVVRPLDGDSEQTRGGLYIPDTAREKPQQGEIIALGPGRFDKGERVPMELRLGQRILYAKYSGAEIRLEDQEVLIIKESDVLAVIG